MSLPYISKYYNSVIIDENSLKRDIKVLTINFSMIKYNYLKVKFEINIKSWYNIIDIAYNKIGVDKLWQQKVF